MSTLVIQDLQNVASYCDQIDSGAANRVVGGSNQPVPVHKACFSSAKNAQSYYGLLNNDGGVLVSWLEGSCVRYVCVSDF